MPTISLKKSNLLSNMDTRRVFEAVVQPRTISFRDLRRNLPNQNLTQSIQLLKDADLIAEKSAIIDDFNTLYVTATGLNAALALRSSGLKF
jgi:hypothetical protein